MHFRILGIDSVIVVVYDRTRRDVPVVMEVADKLQLPEGAGRIFILRLNDGRSGSPTRTSPNTHYRSKSLRMQYLNFIYLRESNFEFRGTFARRVDGTHADCTPQLGASE